jgi:hypothetical protein
MLNATSIFSIVKRRTVMAYARTEVLGWEYYRTLGGGGVKTRVFIILVGND